MIEEQIELADRITLSISRASNGLLEEIQHHLRRGGHRFFKAAILQDALALFAEKLGIEREEIVGEIPSDEPIGPKEKV